MLSDFENFVRKNKLFSKKDKLLLAISGGMDSICLFHLLLQGGYTFALAHCNFQLRGKESDADETFINKLATKHKIPVFIRRFDTAKISASEKKGTQEIARELRYNWFNSLLINEKFDRLLTAHHMSDNTETMLIHLLRSTGISGLHGIPVSNTKIVRPLMFIGRRDIEAYVVKKKYAYRKDASNDSDDYLRNRIRHIVLPAVYSIEPNADKSFFHSSNRILEFELLCNELLEQLKKKHCTEKNGVIAFNDSIFKGISDAGVLLYYLLKDYGFSRSDCSSFGAIHSIQTGKKIKAGDYTFVRERNGFTLLHERKAFETHILLDRDAKSFKHEVFNISIKYIKPIDVDYTKKSTLFIDADKCTFPLRIRPWQAADKMRPLGMKGSKKISDILTDKKTAHHERLQRFVLLDGNGSIMALLPEVCSELYRLDKGSRRILALRVKNR